MYTSRRGGGRARRSPVPAATRLLLRVAAAQAMGGAAERLEGAAGSTELSPGHDLTHKPPHHKCPTCMATKLQRAPAAKAKDAEATRTPIAKEPYEYGQADTVQVRCPDHRGYNLALVTLDGKTKPRRSRAMPDKSSSSVWKAYSELFPGNRMGKNPYLREALGVLFARSPRRGRFRHHRARASGGRSGLGAPRPRS